MGREPGSAPGGAVTFFRFAERKSPKKGRPQVCDPCAALRGKPASGRLRGAPWNSLCAARAAQTTTASQFTKHARCDARATPQPPRRRRSHRGWTAETSQQPHGSSLRSTPPHGRKRHALRRQGRAKQWPDWMFGCSAPPPLCMRRGAQRPADQGSRLSERSEFERDPAGREHRRLPGAQRRDADSGVAFFCLLFLATQEKKVRRRAHIPAPALCTSKQSDQRASPPASTSSARTDVGVYEARS
jgi:hypothetical protein